MAKLSVDGLSDFMMTMDEIATMPENVVDEMLHAEAEIVAAATRTEATALGMGYGGDNERHTTETNRLPGQKHSYSTGATARAVAVSKLKKNAKGKWVSVYFKGTRPDGKKASEIAFLNEYGTRTINARSFVRIANEKSAAAATEAAAAVYDQYLKSKNL